MTESPSNDNLLSSSASDSSSGSMAEPTPTVTPTPTASPAANQAVTDYNAITNALLSSISDIGTKSSFKLMIYGEPGSTKSSFLGTAPNNLVYDFEDGLIAAKTAHVHSNRQMRENIQAIPFKSLQQADALIERLSANSPEFDSWTVFSVDTISSMHKRMLEAIMKREKANRPQSVNEYVPETEHYTEVNEILTRFIRSLADMDRDIIILAHAQTVEPKGKQAKTYPDFSEKLANKLEAMMDVVGYMFKVEEEIDGQKISRPYLRVQSDGIIHAKSRIPLPPVILDPTYEQIKAEWNKAVGAPNG